MENTFAPKDPITNKKPTNTSLLKHRALITILLAGVLSSTGCNTDGCNPKPSLSQKDITDAPTEPLTLGEAFKKDQFRGLAMALDGQALELNERNQIRFEEVLILMRNNLEGINVDYELEDSVALANTKIKRDYNNISPSISFSKDWQPSNPLDLSVAVHEIHHLAEILRSHGTLSESNWQKIYSAPGNYIEIRTELSAWELQAEFFNSITDGSLEKLFQQAKSTKTPEEAMQMIEQVKSELSAEYNITSEDKKLIIDRLAKVYFSLKITDTCDEYNGWSYSNAVTIADWYIPSGINMFELSTPSPGVNAVTDKCVYPLPTDYNYTYCYLYEKQPQGYYGPSTTPTYFNR